MPRPAALREFLQATIPPQLNPHPRSRPQGQRAAGLAAATALAAAALTAAALPAGAATTAVAGPGPGTAVAGFGFNDRGQLGNSTNAGTTKAVLLPVLAALPAGTRVIQVAPGCAHSLALTSTGSVLAWGDNSSGQLGNGATSPFSATPAPVPLPAGVRIRSVSGGCSFSLAVTTSGQVYAWGSNSTGTLGNGQTGGFSATPGLVKLPAGVRIRSVAGGFDHALAVTTEGQVYAWGGNDDGQLGNGSDGPATGTPALVPLPDGARATTVTAGERDSLAVTTRGRILGWGNEADGALGDGHLSGFTARPVRTLLPPFARARSVFAGCFHTLALTTTGSVYAFGSNGSGELGIGRFGDQARPVRAHLPAGTRVTAVGGGCTHSVAVTSRGQMLAWGTGNLLGNGSATGLSTVPVLVRLDRGQFAIATGGSAGGDFSLALVLRQPAR
jgi:alpha-tubulin suppressor-like RCC1 family protein